MFIYMTFETYIPKYHPMRPIGIITDKVLAVLSREFEAMYSHTGRPSIPPEQLLKTLLLQKGYQVSLRIRNIIEEAFAWVKTVDNLRKTRYRGIEKLDWYFTLALSAYNLVRMRNMGVAAS
jgi:hypothetical protein